MKVKKVKKITTAWLIEKKACVSGVKWFRRNYPKGMTITKKNITELVNKLHKRGNKKDTWESSQVGIMNTADQMCFLLCIVLPNNHNGGHISVDTFFYKFKNSPNIPTLKNIVNDWWKIYKQY